MSKADAKKFLQAMEKEPKLRDQSVKGVIATAKKAGFTITPQDWESALKERWGLKPPPDTDGHPHFCCSEVPRF